MHGGRDVRDSAGMQLRTVERGALVAGVALVVGTVGVLVVRDRMRAPVDDGPLTVVSGAVNRGEHDGYDMYLRYRPPAIAGADPTSLDAPRLRIKTACRVGDRVLADNGLWAGDGLRDPSLPDGVDENILFHYYELPARPDRCQVELHVDRGLTPTGEVRTFCLDGGEDVSTGPCAPPVVSTRPPGPDPVVSEVSARRDDDGDLVISYTVTAARPAQDGLDVDFDITCRTRDGGEATGSGGCSSEGVDQLDAGESVRCGQIPFNGREVAPTTCDLVFHTSMHAEPSATPLATYCADVTHAAVRAGACP
jgi:hypothetical protein